MPHLTFHLFGAPRLQRDGAPVHIPRRRAVACAVYLAVTGREVSRDALAALFWPETDPYHAYADLRRTLHLLHQVLGPARLVVEQEHVRLQRDANLWLDVEHFRHLLSACHGHGHSPQEVCQECLPLLAAAAVLYRDDFLTGFALPDSPDFDRWQLFESEQLRHELASALARLVRGHTAQGEFAHAIAYARRWVALDPLDEPAQRWLMQLYAWSGERSAALLQYQFFVRSLAQELAVEPEPATSQLEEAIRAGRLPPPATAEQLGVVVGRIQRITQVETTPFGEDELRVVTVLCAGLYDPEHTIDLDTLVAATDRLLTMTAATCALYGGRVERMPGGDVLAIFGPDRSHEDDAERAIRAALAIQQSAQAEALAISIGINTGMAYCMRAGPAKAAEALLMGTMVNLAARLRNRAGSGGILVGSAAYRPTRRGVRLCQPGTGIAWLCPACERLPGLAPAQPCHEGTGDRGLAGRVGRSRRRDGSAEGRHGASVGRRGAAGSREWRRRPRQISPGGGAQGGLDGKDRRSAPGGGISPWASLRAPSAGVAGRSLPGAGECHRLRALCGDAAPPPGRNER